MHEMKRMTSGKYNDMVLYFTSNSILAGDDRVVFIRSIDGCQNLFLLDMNTGEEKQITYFSETAPMNVSINGFRLNDFNCIISGCVAFCTKTNLLFFLKGRSIYRYDLKGNGRILAVLPYGTATGQTHVSEDGKKFIVSTVDDRAFDNYDGTNNDIIDDNVQRLGLCSQLRVFDTETGEELLVETITKAWVTHVQFSPLDNNIILYNHEWPGDCGIRRMWLFDGKNHIRLRSEGDGRHRDDWTCHEMWERSTGNLIYHGTYKNGISYIGRIKFANSTDRENLQEYTITEIPFPKEYTKYGHFTVSNTDLLVTDGYYQEDGEADSGRGEWICVLKPDWEKKTIEWIPLCKHGSNWDCQASHPHPVFNHAANAIYFTSNKEGVRAVYKVDL